jgi:Transmembrane exosortase (Exosortase_EpsH).
MNRQWAIVAVRLGLTFASVWFGFVLLITPWRHAEAGAVISSLHHLGVNRVYGSYGNKILVIPNQNRPFIAEISPSCSALAAVLAFGAVALLLFEGPVRRRMAAFAAAAGLVLVCNMIRISLSIVVGIESDAHGLVVFHDWIGTLFGLLYVLGGFTAFLFLLLPSNKRLLAEVSGDR